MEAIDERNNVLAPLPYVSPFPGSEDLAGVRIDEDIVIGKLFAARSGMWHSA